MILSVGVKNKTFFWSKHIDILQEVVYYNTTTGCKEKRCSKCEMF